MSYASSHNNSKQIYLVTSGCMGGNGCCTLKDCYEGEGDCDTDGQCVEGLVCGSDNCMSVYGHEGMDWDDTDDCCTPGNFYISIYLSEPNRHILMLSSFPYNIKPFLNIICIFLFSAV